jgi:hypothetical protein
MFRRGRINIGNNENVKEHNAHKSRSFAAMRTYSSKGRLGAALSPKKSHGACHIEQAPRTTVRLFRAAVAGAAGAVARPAASRRACACSMGVVPHMVVMVVMMVRCHRRAHWGHALSRLIARC